MKNIDYSNSYFDLYSSNSDSKSADETENFSILNFDNDTYQDVKSKILQQNSCNENKDYNLNNELEENILSKFDEGVDEILSDQPTEDDKYILYIIVDNDNDEKK
ncbi:9229_t:CDS:1 [Racocetra fulgida]|uniref:9229_t:CDS:1 n=1 Tax=Racocetra fulgida TaxID=60492 RepID=A0A9N8Z0J2_9GLOM|nr:9229_t:CDS:1 [Racocetra fulgida]